MKDNTTDERLPWTDHQDTLTLHPVNGGPEVEYSMTIDGLFRRMRYGQEDWIQDKVSASEVRYQIRLDGPVGQWIKKRSITFVTSPRLDGKYSIKVTIPNEVMSALGLNLGDEVQINIDENVTFVTSLRSDGKYSTKVTILKEIRNILKLNPVIQINIKRVLSSSIKYKYNDEYDR